MIDVGAWLFVGKSENVKTMIETSQVAKIMNHRYHISGLNKLYCCSVTFYTRNEIHSLTDPRYVNIVVQSNTHRTSEGIQ